MSVFDGVLKRVNGVNDDSEFVPLTVEALDNYTRWHWSDAMW